MSSSSWFRFRQFGKDQAIGRILPRRGFILDM
jgi:hypothetical protein